MIDWQEILSKHPKSFELAFGKVRMDGEDRQLYGFFDERGIYIDMECWTMDGKFRFTVNEIYKDGQELRQGQIWKGKYETRTEAETAAFTKAFEILEERL